MSKLNIQLPSPIHSLVTDDAFAGYAGTITNDAARRQLLELSPSDLFDLPITDRDLGSCCLSGLWLLHNFLDDSHQINQSIHTAEGSFWHAIMHRLEGDFSNSKYWYRKVGPHPVLESLAAKFGDKFVPFDFVDRCEKESRSGKLSAETYEIAIAEWIVLFEYCHQHAVA